jgi:hypothetical protein
METKPNETVDIPAAHIETFVIYKGNPFFSLDGSMLWLGIAIFIEGGWLGIANDPEAFLVSGIGAIFFILFTTRFYYFSCSERGFVVRNHFMWWIKKTYSLPTLTQLSFEMPFRTPGCVRLITKDGENSRFPAGSLADSQWIALKEQLEKQNVSVRDEFVDKIELVEFVIFDEIKEIFSRFNKK